MKQKIKRFAPKFKIKKGDNVMVISGADKGSTGEVKEVISEKSRVIVEGINMVKKHLKATEQSRGGIEEMEAPIHISNVMLIDPKSGEPTRVGRKQQDGNSVRYAIKSGEIIK